MIGPSALVASVTAVAIALSEGRTSEETALLGCVFSQLGDTLATISTQKSAIEAKNNEIKNLPIKTGY